MISNALQLENAVLGLMAKKSHDLDLSGSTIPIEFIFESSLTNIGKNILYVGEVNKDVIKKALNIIEKGSSITIVHNSQAKLWFEQEFIESLEEEFSTRIVQINGFYRDLKLSPSDINNYLPISTISEYDNLQSILNEKKNQSPLLKSEEFDEIIINLSLNQVEFEFVENALNEYFRLLKRGGKIRLSVLLADEELNLENQLIAKQPFKTIFPEQSLYSLLNKTNFYGLTLNNRSKKPLKVTNGIEIRQYVFSIYKGKEGKCLDQGHAVMYTGPWKEIWDDDGHQYIRGERTAVCEKTFNILSREPYADFFVHIPPYIEIPLNQAPEFNCVKQIRDIRVTKGIVSVHEINDDNSCC